MVALVVCMLLLFVLATLFSASSSNFAEAERSSREIENGRYAAFVLRDEILHAGFYGEIASVTNLELTPPITMPVAMPDPCATSIAAAKAALPLAIQGVDAPSAAPTCVPDRVAGTDILVIRRSNTTTVSAGSAVANGYYTQVSECATQAPVFMLANSGFTSTLKDCATTADCPSVSRQHLLHQPLHHRHWDGWRMRLDGSCGTDAQARRASAGRVQRAGSARRGNREPATRIRNRHQGQSRRFAELLRG